MDLNIECPVCEEKLCVDSENRDQDVNCPSCSRSFAIASAIQIDTAPTSSTGGSQENDPESNLVQNARFRTDKTVPPAKLPTKPQRKQSSKAAVATPETDSGLPKVKAKTSFKARKKSAAKAKQSISAKQRPAPKSSELTVGKLDQSSSTIETEKEVSGVESIRLERELRDRSRFINTLVTGGVLLLIIGGLAVMLILQLRKVDQMADDPEPSINVESNEPEVNASPATDLKSDQPAALGDLNDPKLVKAPEDKPARQFKLKFDDLPPQKFDYLKRSQVDNAWTVIQPYLVHLKVHDARGSHLAVGTIVDTRGWILTSYQSIVGASKIEVTQSAKSIDEFSDDLLTDQVRGVIGIDKANDLVLLSINRRFVISFADVQYADTTTIVETAYFVQCAPPTLTNPYARHEAKITVRGTLDDLDGDAQSKAIRSKLGEPIGLLDEDKDGLGNDELPLTWLVATSGKQPLPGTPLVNVDGELVGMNVFSDSRSSQYLMVDDVFDLIVSSDDKPQAMSVLGGVTSESILVAVPEGHELRAASVGLNKTGESCKEFNWIAETLEQYQTLQEFAGYYSELHRYSIEHVDSDDRTDKIISKQATAWQNTLTKRFVDIIQSNNNEDDRKNLQQMNQKFAKEAIQAGGQVVPFFGQVDPAGIIGERMILNLYGDGTSVSVPFVPRDIPMRLESEWLIFVEAPANPKTVVFKTPNGQAITCNTAFNMLNFGIEF